MGDTSKYIDNPYRAIISGDYILPPGAKEKRSRYELSFINIGTATVLGGLSGALLGGLDGIKNVRHSNLGINAQRTQILNHIVKRSSSSAQNLGLFTFIYSVYGVAAENVRGKDDELNTIAASGLSMATFFASKGLKPALGMASIGISISSAVYFLTKNQYSRKFIPEFMQ
ncbi:MAG: mitochondrial import inner membrane translocase, subunit timm23 [Marteilia pararefringens]